MCCYLNWVVRTMSDKFRACNGFNPARASPDASRAQHARKRNQAIIIRFSHPPKESAAIYPIEVQDGFPIYNVGNDCDGDGFSMHVTLSSSASSE